jgi:glucosyl-3-phosphoglycerate synthase
MPRIAAGRGMMALMSAPRRLDHRDFDLDALVAAKRASGRTVSLCLPARNEADTIAAIVKQIVGHPLLDEVLVMDDHSTDDTVAAATDAGARVLHAADVLPYYGSGPGKGQALWKATAVARGDVIAFCDADLQDFGTHFVVGLLGPLLVGDSVAFVKAFYERPGNGHLRGGGRVTELVARPLLHLHFPHLAGTVQPLAGEFAAPRAVLESVPFVEGYGVDIGLLIDIASAHGVDRLAQVDLGVRKHRNRPLTELGPMATIVLMTMLRRAGVEAVDEVRLDRPGARAVDVRYRERPPLATLPEAAALRG